MRALPHRRPAHRQVGSRRHGPPLGDREQGVGLIGTVAASGAFVLFLLFAVQLTVHLYATSTVTAAGHDAARALASRTTDHSNAVAVDAATRRAEADLRELLGDAGRRADITWDHDGDVVRLRVVVAGPGVLPDAIRSGIGLGPIDRTFQVRVERTR